jgi:Fe-S-cluster-containing dehydrogenase component
MSACPWGAPQWNPETGKVVKCDYCMDRIDQGLKPVCVTVCTTQCLNFGRANELPAVRRERYAQAMAALE